MASPIIVAHRILIGAAILFGAFFTGWQLVKYRQTASLEHLIVGLVSAVITVGLAYYLKNLRRYVGDLPPPPPTPPSPPAAGGTLGRP
jgi:hypothetical protein